MQKLDELLPSSLSRHVVKNQSKGLKREEYVVLPDRVKSALSSTLSLSELMSREYPESEWIVDRLIPEGLTIMSAQPASFKTWLILRLALDVASGSKFIGAFDTKKVAVLMIDEENDPRLLQQRLKLLQGKHDLPIDLMMEKNFKVGTKDVINTLKLCKERSIKLITIDSLVRIHDKNENDAVQMAQVFAELRRFTKAGISVLITHHNRKGGRGDSGSQEMRGSSDILAAVDCHLSIERSRQDNKITIHQNKVRFDQELEPVEVSISKEDDSVDLEFAGMLRPEKSKRAKLAELVHKVLSEVSTLNQKKLLIEVERAGIKTNIKTLRAVLSDMLTKNELTMERGKGSEILYKNS